MKYLVVGLVCVTYLLVVTMIMTVNNNVVYTPQTIYLGETYANTTETTEHRSDQEIADK